MLGAFLFAAPASAEPEKAAPAKPSAPKVAPKADLPIRIDLAPKAALVPSDRTPGFGGKDAVGRVLVPAPHPDARDWPHGSLIRPPETGDHNVIVPGTDSLPWFRPLRPDLPVTRQLLDELQRGIGGFVSLIVPPPS
jgi:hypothetical protein